MTAQELKALWKKEEEAAFSGWDFSHLQGRYVEDPLPWDYREKVLDFLKQDSRLLDMGTGGGEFLLSLGHPPALTAVTEGWKPNLELCRKRLSPLGIQVEECVCESGVPMPFESESFDLVLNRHESYDFSEVYRVLKPGGFLITQQVGGQNGRALAKRLLPEFTRLGPDFNLENQEPKMKEAGFRVMYRNQAYPAGKFLDIGALCYHAKVIQWEFPGFSVERCFDRLLELQKEIEARGFVENREHRFILIGKKQ